MIREREQRRKVDIPCELAGLEGVADARVRDLSSDGCRLLSPHLGSDGERLMISLTLPGAMPEVHLVAETRWSDLTTGRNLYTLGCRFVHSRLTRSAIGNLLQAIEGNRLPELKRKPGDETRRIRRG